MKTKSAQERGGVKAFASQESGTNEKEKKVKLT